MKIDTLLVEDDRGLRDALTQVLEGRGHRVTACADATAAWAALQQREFPLILLDWLLPGMNGLDLCRQIRAMPSGARSHIVMLTGHVQQADMQTALAAGVDDYLVKPFDLDVLHVRLTIAERYVAAVGQRAQAEAERARIEGKLRASEERFRILVEQAPVWVSIIDEQGHFEMVNAAASALVGYTPEELIGQKFTVLFAEHQAADLLAAHHVWVAQPSTAEQDFEVRTKHGAPLSILARSAALRDAAGRPQRAIFIIDITERKEAERRLERRAHYDALTGLPNRTLFGELVDHALERARRQKRIVAVLFVDLDGFKQVNDTWGHAVGDALLSQVAQCLRRAIRESESDSVARLAGDEFAIVLPDIGTGENAARVARQILTALSQGFDVDGHALPLTASIGISLSPFAGQEFTTLLANADRAMYIAKKRGKNTFAFFTEPN